MPTQSLDRNGYERYGWRMVDGKPAQVVIEIGFTVRGLDSEAIDHMSFKTRMQHFCSTLETAYGFEVKDMTIHKREGKAPWCEFDCRTPEYYLPAVIRSS